MKPFKGVSGYFRGAFKLSIDVWVGYYFEFFHKSRYKNNEAVNEASISQQESQSKKHEESLVNEVWYPVGGELLIKMYSHTGTPLRQRAQCRRAILGDATSACYCYACHLYYTLTTSSSYPVQAKCLRISFWNEFLYSQSRKLYRPSECLTCFGDCC